MKELESWYKEKTKNMTVGKRAKFRLMLQKKLCKSQAVITRWLKGESEPNQLERKAINIILQSKIYNHEK